MLAGGIEDRGYWILDILNANVVWMRIVREDDILCLLESEREARRLR